MPKYVAVPRLAILILAVAAVAQSAVLVKRVTSGGIPPMGPPTPVVGDAVGTLVGLDEGETETIVDWDHGSHGWNLVLAFSERCVWTSEVAAAWRHWLDEERPEHVVRILLVTTDSVASAKEFIADHGWTGELLSRADPRLPWPEVNLWGRTPWFFLIDRDGRIHLEGNGANLPNVNDFLARTSGKDRQDA